MTNNPEKTPDPIVIPEIVKEPDSKSVYDYIVFGLSIPERAMRVTAGMLGGAIRESSELLLPQAFKSSQSYGVFVGQMLQFCTHDVGGVRKQEDAERDDQTKQIEAFVARKAVGNFIELAGIASLHVSPILFLAVISDIAYGSKAYLHELGAELKREGLVNEETSIDNAAELLDAIAQVSGHTSGNLNLPPISVEGLKESIEQTKTKLQLVDGTMLIPQSELQSLWSDMRQIASQENLNLLQVSGSMSMYTLNQMATIGKSGLSTVRVAGSILDQKVFKHYRDAVTEIRTKGFYEMLKEESQPYITSVWYNFSFDRPTVTQDVLSGKMAGRVWHGVRGWLKPGKS